MSIASETNRNNYLGNGSVKTYSYTFKIFNDDELLVTVKSTLDVETTLSLTTHYTVANAGSNSGGSITLVNGAFDWIDSTFLKNGYTLSIRRNLELIQETDIRNQGEFFPEIHEDAFDRLIMVDQQQQDQIDRTVKLSETADVADFDPSLPVEIIGEINKVLMTNATGDGFQVGPSATDISSAAGSAAAAAASAAAALVSENAAAASAAAALGSEIGAASSEAAAAGSEAAAAISEANAAAAAAAAVSAHEADTSNVHGIVDTSLLVTTTGTQVLTNKDIDGGTASNTSRITLPKAAKATLDGLTRKEATLVYASDTDKLYYDDGSILKLVGSGAGGETNFITDGDAEGAQILTVYNDSSTTRPVDGTGGTQANLAVSISSSSPLIGTNSFLFTKSGSASTQGSGASIPFTIDSAYKAKVLQIEFDYIVNSGTFVAGSSSAESDVIVYLYDVTNSTLIEPSSIKLLSNSSTISDKFTANFQTSATGTSYRLILHCQSTSTADYELKLDNITVKPSRYVYGTPITDWVSFTATVTNFTVSSQKSLWRRVGDSMQIRYFLNFNSAASSTIRFDMPSGYTINSSKMDYTANDGNVGYATANRTAANNYLGHVQPGNTSGGFRIVTNAGNEWTTAVPITWASGDRISAFVEVPISGWSSSTQVSDGYDGRLIAASYVLTSNLTINTSATDLTGWSSVYDTTASFNGTTGVYTIPSSGEYQLDLALRLDTGGSAATQHVIEMTGTGSIGTYNIAAASDLAASKGYNYYPSYSFRAKAGDTIKVRVTSATNASTAIGSQSLISIKKLQAPTTISATEVVSFKGYVASNQALTAATTNLPFTSVKDSHNVWTGSTYPVPHPGDYFVSLTLINSSGAGTYHVYVDGAQPTGFALFTADTTTFKSGSVMIPNLRSGQVLSIRSNASVTTLGDLGSNISIFRIK